MKKLLSLILLSLGILNKPETTFAVAQETEIEDDQEDIVEQPEEEE